MLLMNCFVRMKLVFLEPKLDFSICFLLAARGMNHIFAAALLSGGVVHAYMGKIPPYCAGSSLMRRRVTNQSSGIVNSMHSLNSKSYNRPFCYEFNQFSKERLCFMSAVMRFCKLLIYPYHLNPQDFQTSILKSLYYLSNQSPFNAVWLYYDKAFLYQNFTPMKIWKFQKLKIFATIILPLAFHA